MNQLKTAYTRGQLAKLTKVNAETIRYYEKSGLLEEPKRGSNGYRLYFKEDVDRLRFIRRCRELGFSVNEIKALLSLSHLDEAHCEQVKEASKTHLNDIQNKIRDLLKIQSSLTDLIKQCEDNTTPSCPMLENLFS